MKPGRSLRIVVLGAMGRHPYGGQTWLYLNWLRGLSRLGHEVLYVEDSPTWPYDPVNNTRPADCAYTRRHLETSLVHVGLAGQWALRVDGLPGACWGRDEEELKDAYGSCDLLLNAAGGELDHRQREAPLRVWLQTDPVTAELRLATGDESVRRIFDSHHVVATYGERYGLPGCGVPLPAIDYVPTRQPVDLDLWPMAFAPDAETFTTIGNYRQSGWDVEFRGETYKWSKHEQWERFLQLPAATGQRFEVALSSIRAKDRRHLKDHGWRVRSAIEVSLDALGSYACFVRTSRAGFTVAKDQNIRLRSGWFSEREACYLASGKPVITQDTGAVLPAGEGMFAVTDLEAAVRAVKEINANYEHHCRVARAIADEHLEARRVAGRLLSDVGLG